MPKEEHALSPDPGHPQRQINWFKMVLCVLTVASILSTFALLDLFDCSHLFRERKADFIHEEHSNAKQIGLALFEFDADYGTFPSDATVGLVAKSHPAHGFDLSGKSSNAIFRQLFAVGYTQSEQMFYAKVNNLRKPDGVILPGEALKKGEVGFAYISGLTSKEDPNTPIVLAPMIPGTTKFDPNGFRGRGNAVVLHIDGSARTYKIEKDGRIYDMGIDLLSSKHPVWKGKKPDIRYPE
jgi:hypothetical protein